jgi:hypothetical protein
MGFSGETAAGEALRLRGSIFSSGLLEDIAIISFLNIADHSRLKSYRAPATAGVLAFRKNAHDTL